MNIVQSVSSIRKMTRAAFSHIQHSFAGGKDGESDLNGNLRVWRRIGWAIVAGFMGGSLLWAANARLDSAAIASGVVSVESNRKTIQHLEGGIISEILVREGERVEAGQPLFRMEGMRSRAAFDLLNGRLHSAMALRARLIAERDGLGEINFPDELIERSTDPAVSQIMMGEIDVFKTQQDRIENQESILRERASKLRMEISGLNAQVDASREQLSLLKEEITAIASLVEKGLAPNSRLLALKRRGAELSGNIGEYRAQIARAGDSISEIELQTIIPRQKLVNEANQQLQSVQAQIAELREKVLTAGDVVRRSTILAPQSGRVVELAVHTVGGVVQPGEHLMDLVPDRDRLVVDVRVDPRDIDAVYRNMPAQIRLTAFNARTTPLIEGVLVSVSPDRVTDPNTGASYFTARVQPSSIPEGFDMAAISPGMQAEVFLVMKARTVLDYMIEPIVRSFEKAGRES
ncbi:MAG: HlyD family type I secretion periplasmic adaptor subunit [Rhodospirillales bacterium]|nr:HlyD family type I secretion periplasmic adaptor subunit [Rhodospirillales bacterium]MCW8952359.1 HlyD family type I secretion periplasmic adaptor subunit [Rhodospirillales bacterium]MCW8970105.1 HlyD family type I secretion periplasmic adaptor subunit [Rhodospirillales bacterium]